MIVTVILGQIFESCLVKKSLDTLIILTSVKILYIKDNFIPEIANKENDINPKIYNFCT